MTRHIKLTGGVGVNANYTVVEDRKVIGYIRHPNRRGFWNIEDVGYRTLATSRVIADAKVKAETIAFPTPLEVHEERLLSAIDVRRSMAERHFGSLLAATLAAVISGSNSARADADGILKRIEDFGFGHIEKIDGIYNEPRLPDAPTKETTT